MYDISRIKPDWQESKNEIDSLPFDFVGVNCRSREKDCGLFEPCEFRNPPAKTVYGEQPKVEINGCPFFDSFFWASKKMNWEVAAYPFAF